MADFPGAGRETLADVIAERDLLAEALTKARDKILLLEECLAEGPDKSIDAALAWVAGEDISDSEPQVAPVGAAPVAETPLPPESPPPAAGAALPVKAPVGPSSRWPESRDTLLRRMWREQASGAEIAEALNALSPMAVKLSGNDVYRRAYRLELPKRDSRGMKRTARAAPAAAETAKAAVRRGVPSKFWTAPIFDETLDVLWAKRDTAEEIARALNAMAAPGHAKFTAQIIYNRVKDRDLPRRKPGGANPRAIEARKAQAARAREMREASERVVGVALPAVRARASEPAPDGFIQWTDAMDEVLRVYAVLRPSVVVLAKMVSCELGMDIGQASVCNRMAALNIRLESREAVRGEQGDAGAYRLLGQRFWGRADIRVEDAQRHLAVNGFYLKHRPDDLTSNAPGWYLHRGLMSFDEVIAAARAHFGVETTEAAA